MATEISINKRRKVYLHIAKEFQTDQPDHPGICYYLLHASGNSIDGGCWGPRICKLFSEMALFALEDNKQEDRLDSTSPYFNMPYLLEEYNDIRTTIALFCYHMTND